MFVGCFRLAVDCSFKFVALLLIALCCVCVVFRFASLCACVLVVCLLD